MALTGAETGFGNVLIDDMPHGPGRQEVLAQLESIVSSSLFRNSKRYPSLLRYIVDEALAGRADGLKERTLGICVFGRNLDYDTNADPVVRISAGEVRKRIAQYYQTPGHHHELRIEIPLGSYVPRFFYALEEAPRASQSSAQHHPPAQADVAAQEFAAQDLPTLVGPLTPEPPVNSGKIAFPVASPSPAGTRGRLHITLLYALLAALAITWGLSQWHVYNEHRLPPATALFWSHFLHPSSPTLIVLGVHSFDAEGNDISYRTHASLPQTEASLLSNMTRSDMIHLGDLTSYASLTTLLTRHNHSFRTQGASDTTLEQLREGPFILVGGFNNLWTTKLVSQLRYRFITLNGRVNVIQDSQHPEHTWTLDSSQSALNNTRDYALVSCYLDSTTDQYVMVVAGIGKSGTEAASDFVTNDKELSTWLRDAKTQSGDNIQIVLSTDVIEGKHGQPHVVETYRW